MWQTHLIDKIRNIRDLFVQFHNTQISMEINLSGFVVSNIYRKLKATFPVHKLIPQIAQMTTFILIGHCTSLSP